MGTLSIKNGDLVLDGVSDISGIQFPDGSRLYSARSRVKTHTSLAGIVTINWNVCEVARITLTENTSFVFTGGLDMQNYLLEIKQAAGTLYSCSMPSSVKFGSDIPVYSGPITVGKRDKIIFVYNVNEACYDFVTVSRGF